MVLRGLGVTAAEYGLIATPPALPPVAPSIRTVGVSPGTYTIRVRGLRDASDAPTIGGLRLDILGVLLAVVATATIVIAKTAK